jgi:hypothetical protein
MTDLIYYIILGLLGIVALVLVFSRPDDEDPLVSRRRYLALTVDIIAIVLVSLFRFGALGALIGGC